MSNLNINNHFNEEFVELSRGLGLMKANCEREAEMKDYFVLGSLINRGRTDEYAKNGYVENDSCFFLWEGWGLDRPEINESIYWLTINGYIDQIWLDNSRLAYKVPQWILDKVDARMTQESIDRCDATIDGLKEEKLKIDPDQVGAAEAKRMADGLDQAVEVVRRERDRLKEKYDMLISRLKNVDCGVCEERER